MHVGIATDHGGFSLKEDLVVRLREAGHEVVDFGAKSLVPGDDYPDYVTPLARAVTAGTVERGTGAIDCLHRLAFGGEMQREAAGGCEAIERLSTARVSCSG